MAGLVLLALLRLRNNAYGMMVRREIEQRPGRSASLGAVYTTLARLEQKGYIWGCTKIPAKSDIALEVVKQQWLTVAGLGGLPKLLA